MSKKKIKKIKLDGESFNFGFEENREVMSCPGVLLLFRKGHIVHVEPATDVFRAVSDERHRGKNFDNWNYIPAHYEDIDSLAFRIIEKYDPIYSPHIPF